MYYQLQKIYLSVLTRLGIRKSMHPTKQKVLQMQRDRTMHHKYEQVLTQLLMRTRVTSFARYLPSNYSVTLKLGVGPLKVVKSATIR